MSLGWITKKSEKRGPGDRVRGLPLDELPLHIAPWLQALRGPLEVRRCLPVGKEEGRGKGTGVVLGRGCCLVSVSKQTRHP